MKPFQEQKIIVLGGSGESGKRIIAQLRQRYPKLNLTSAARHAQSPNTNVNTLRLDINNTANAVAILVKYDLAIIALGPMERVGNKAHRLCLQAGIDAIDINDSLSAADQILSLHNEATSKGLSLFTGMGFAPGLSSLLLTQLIAQQASTKGHYHCRLYMGGAYGGGKSSPYAMLASFSNSLESFTHGKRNSDKTPWKDSHSRFYFPTQSKPLKLIPFATPEIVVLASGRCAKDIAINTLDSRYHIQYLSQGFARLLACFKLSNSVKDFFAAKFFSNGQSMKNKKDTNPDTTLWVYPDGQPEQGLMIHGVISSYDLTALMACAVTECWLHGELNELQGVHAIEHLPTQKRQKLTQILNEYGISSQHANKKTFKQADLFFGWIDQPAYGDPKRLRNFAKNWYNLERPHPKMATLQKRFLLESAIWKTLKQNLKGLRFIGFIIKTLLRWKKHNDLLVTYRQQNDALKQQRWKNITRDISMFTSGYSCARDVLGKETAYKLYKQLFLNTGKMEMRWLWPKAQSFAVFNQPEETVKQYWSAFIFSYQELGLLDAELSKTHQGMLNCHISNCAYAKMFNQLGCLELSNLIREMEREALEYIISQTKLKLKWRGGKNGSAKISLV